MRYIFMAHINMSTQSEIVVLNQDIENIQLAIKNLAIAVGGDIKTIRDTLNVTLGDVQDLKAIEVQLNNIQQNFTDFTNSINAQLNNLSSNLDGLSTSNNNLTSEIDGLKTSLNNSNSEIDSLKTSLNNSNSEIDSLKSSVSDLNARLLVLEQNP